MASRPGNEQLRVAVEGKHREFQLDDRYWLECELVELGIDHGSGINGVDWIGWIHGNHRDRFDELWINDDSGINDVVRIERDREHRRFELGIDFDSGIKRIVRDQWHIHRGWVGFIGISVDVDVE